MVRPYSWRDRPTAKSQMSIISCTSPGLLGDLAGFDRYQLAEVGLVLTQHFAEQAHQLATARGRHAAPGFEGALGLIDAGDGLGLAEQFHRGDLAAVDRRVNRVVALGV